MSLNGLNEEKVNQAYESAIADPAGWFLLKYSSRDEVDLLNGGSGGFVEARDAIASYDEPSPLFGLVVYRRKKVLLKYVPDGTSRLLQARLTVHLQSVIERFLHDALITLVSAANLSETALSAAVSTLKSSGSFRSNNTKSPRPLTEILEDASENPNQKRVQPAIPKREEVDRTPAEGPSDQVAQKEEEIPAHTLPEEEATVRGRSDSGRQSVSPVKRSSADEHASPERSSVERYSIDRPSIDQPSFDRPSFQSTRSLSREQLAPFTFKPKVKLGPRPSMDNGHPPRKSGSFARPVSTLPAGLRMPTRKKPAESMRPKTQQTSTRPFFTDQGRFPLASSAATVVNVATERPPSRSGSIMTVPAYHHYIDKSSPTSPSITPEKQRLMKALQQRKKHQLARKAAEEASAAKPALDNKLETQAEPDESTGTLVPASAPDISHASADYDLPSSSESVNESASATKACSDYGFPATDELTNGHSKAVAAHSISSSLMDDSFTPTEPAAVAVNNGIATRGANEKPEDIAPFKKDVATSGTTKSTENGIRIDDNTETTSNAPKPEDAANADKKEVLQISTQQTKEALLDSPVLLSPMRLSHVFTDKKSPAVGEQEVEAKTMRSEFNHSVATSPDEEQVDAEIKKSQENESTATSPNRTTFLFIQPEEARTILTAQDLEDPKTSAHNNPDEAYLQRDPLAQNASVKVVDAPEDSTFLETNEIAKSDGTVEASALNASPKHIKAAHESFLLDENEDGESKETDTLSESQANHPGSTIAPVAQDTLSPEQATFASSMEAENESPNGMINLANTAETSQGTKMTSGLLLPSEDHPNGKLRSLEEDLASSSRMGTSLQSQDNEPFLQSLIETVDSHESPPRTPDVGAQSATETTPKALRSDLSNVATEQRPSSSDSNKTAQAVTPRKGHPAKLPPQNDYSDGNSLSGESFLEEIQDATVEEAKPMVVSRSPATPIFPGSAKSINSRKSSDLFRPSSSASTSAKPNQPSMPDSYLARTTSNSSTQLLRNGMLPYRSVSASGQNTSLSIEVSSSASQRLSTIKSPGPAPTSPTLQRRPTTDSPPAKKSSVSSLISQRIKALEKFSNAGPQPNATTATIAPSFVSKRKASLSTPPNSSGVETIITSSARSDSRPYPTPSPSPHGNIFTRTFGSKRPPASEPRTTTAPPPEARKEPVPPLASGTREISEPPHKKPKPVPSPIQIASTTSSTPSSPRLTRPKHQKSSSSYFSRPSKRSKSKTNSVSSISSSVIDSVRDSVPSPTRNSFSSRRSTSSRNGSVDAGQPSSPVRSDATGSRPHSESDKKESKKSRLLRRMSSSVGISPRRNIAHVLSPPLNDQPIAESQEPEPSKKWTPISIGDLNVQFPDTLFWKRRHIEIDSHGYVVLSPSKQERSSRVGTKQYHITEFRLPYVPDQDREELPNSVILDFHDSSTLQYACENPKSQLEVLKVLQSAQDFFSAAERR